MINVWFVNLKHYLITKSSLPGQKEGVSCPDLGCLSIQTVRVPGSRPVERSPGLVHMSVSGAEAEACCGCCLCYTSQLN